MEMTSKTDFPEQGIPQDSDVYVNYYGLAGDPFDPDKPLFFSTPHLEKLHRLFNYLTRFSRKLVVVTGEAGAGKTVLLEHFVEDQHPQDLVCYFAALETDTPQQVLREIADQLELDAADHELPVAEMVEAIKGFSLSRLDEGRSCIVVIDDAHLLNSSVLEQLYQLTCEDSQSRCSIRLLLCGGKNLAEKLRSVVPPEAVDKTLFHQPINPLTSQETQQYLQVHFRENAQHSKPPFAEMEYQRIYQESGGLPGRVNEAARQVMIDGVNGLVEGGEGRRKPPLFALALVVVLLVVSGVFWWQNTGQSGSEDLLASELTGQIERAQAPEENEPSEEEVFVDSLPEQIQGAGESGVSGDAVDASGLESPVLALADKGDSIDLEKENTPGLSDDESLLPNPGLESVLAEVADDAGILESASEGLQPGPEQLETIDVVSVDTDEPAEDSLLRQHARRILAFDNATYTMQLLGSRKEESILATMGKLPGDPDLLYFEKTHKGAPWYVLIYGNYPNRAAADQAAANLPKPLGKLKPWVRGVAGIQKEVILPAE
jgi:DamX protein